MSIIIFLVILTLIFINGLTDAPNAIATLVGSRTMKFNKARKMAAICEVFGIIIMSIISIAVVESITTMIDFKDSTLGLIGLGIGILSTIVFSSVACSFGIPTSESHGLIAGITGSAIAIGGFKAVNVGEWMSVIYGLIWSIVGAGVFTILIYTLFYRLIKKLKEKTVNRMQILSSCGISFMHGAQDGLKFIGILVIFNALISNSQIPQYIDFKSNIVIIIICAVTMAIGVLNGGAKIVQRVGTEMITLNNTLGLCSDFSTISTLLVASLLGMPVSTTHARTLSIIMVGKISGVKVNSSTMADIIKAWILTFPICGGIAFSIMKLIVIIYR